MTRFVIGADVAIHLAQLKAVVPTSHRLLAPTPLTAECVDQLKDRRWANVADARTRGSPLATTTAMSKVLFNFADPNAANGWRAIHDRVMGGVSRSTLRHDPEGNAVFQETVSLERNGGFASVRSVPAIGVRSPPDRSAW
jgi:hypothetical protein